MVTRLPLFLGGAVLAISVSVLGSACSSTSAPANAGADAATPAELDAGAAAPDAAPDPLVEARPYDVHVPNGYDAAKPSALVLAFHGYGDGDNGKLLESYFKLTKVSDAEGFLYVTPNGTKDSTGQQFWNGTNACCDFDLKGTDDVGYVRALVADVAKHFALDPKRVFAVGLSGGAVFVHRLACDAPDLFAAVISVSGATWKDDTKCKPKEGISLVELHGDSDDTVLYAGGELQGVTYPSAKDTVAHWAGHDGCTGGLVPGGAALDLVPSLAGAETIVEHYDGCAKGAVELWTVKGGVHAPPFGPTFGPALWTFFAAHPKP